MCETLQWKSLETVITTESISIVGVRSDNQLIKVYTRFSYNDDPFDVAVKVQRLIKELELNRVPSHASNP